MVFVPRLEITRGGGSFFPPPHCPELPGSVDKRTKKTPLTPCRTTYILSKTIVLRFVGSVRSQREGGLMAAAERGEGVEMSGR